MFVMTPGPHGDMGDPGV